MAELLETIGKALLTAAFIVLVSEVAKRSTLIAALMVAMPLATMMTVAFTYHGTRDATLATRFVTTTFYLIWPGLVFFITLPLAQKLGTSFWTAFALATTLTIAAYSGMIVLLRHLGVEL